MKLQHLFVTGFAEKGIKVSNTPDVLSDGVADMGMTLLLAGARNMYQGKTFHAHLQCGPKHSDCLRDQSFRK